MTEAQLDERGLPAGYPYRPDLEVTPREMRNGMVSGAMFVIDCRTPEEWKAAKIGGSTLVPLDSIASSVEQIEEAAGEREVVIHCHHGGRSLKAALFLRSRGVAAKSMAGGIDLWSRDIDPKVPRY